MPILDGIASVIVGLLLVFTSAVLARESRSLLMGESISDEAREKIKATAEKYDTVVKVTAIVSNYESPDSVWLMMIIEFKDDLVMSSIVESIDKLREEITQRFKPVEYVIIEPLTDGLIERLKKRGIER